MRRANHVGVTTASAIIAHLLAKTSRISSLNIGNVRVLLWGGKRIRTFRSRCDSIKSDQFGGIPLELKRVAEIDSVPEEITFEHFTGENVADYFQRITFPQREQFTRFMTNPT